MSNMITRMITWDNVPEPTAAEYEAQMAPLREALKKEAAKTEVEFYRGLTIRQFAGFWEAASGGRHWSWPLEQLAYEFDLDSPADFYRFYCSLPGNHLLDLDYAVITFYPECADISAPDNEKPWALFIFSHGWPAMTARYVQRLQQADIHFYLHHPKDVLKKFNKEVGYWKRSLRRREKMKKME